MSDDNDISQPPYVPIEVAVLRAELERERMRLAACSVAAMANTPETAARARVIDKDHPYWSASYGDVCAAVDREMKLREQALTISAMLQHANVGPCTLPEGVNNLIVQLDLLKANYDRKVDECREEYRRAEKYAGAVAEVRNIVRGLKRLNIKEAIHKDILNSQFVCDCSSCQMIHRVLEILENA